MAEALSREDNALAMVETIRAALAANPVGTVTVSIDGQTVTYDRKQALAELKFWESVVAEYAGTRPRARTINLSGF